MISNLFQRLDLLKRAYTQLSFTLQLYDTNSNSFVDLSSGTVNIKIVDERGSQYNTSMPNLITLVANDKVQINIHNAIAPDRISTLKYSISYTDASNVETGLLMGIINCVDLAHIPSNTSNYIPNASNIVVNNAVGTSTNVILELQNGLNGADGRDGIDGINGQDGANGGGAEIGYIDITHWNDLQDGLTSDLFTNAITVVSNNMAVTITMRILLFDNDTLKQASTFLVARNAVFVVYRNGKDLYIQN